MKKVTKKSRKDRLRKLLYKKVLTIGDKEELLAEFKNHPSWDIKEGCGIVDIVRDLSGHAGGNICFWLIRKDGSKTDISFIRCVDGDLPKRQYILKACRTAVVDEVLKFKASIGWGTAKCPLSGKILYPEDTHIDHYDKKFVEVYEGWIEDKSENEVYDKLNNREKDGVTNVHFIDEDIEKDFIAFHNANTHLRAVNATANLKLQ